MNHNPAITRVTRRDFGLEREAFVVRCECGLRQEVRDEIAAHRIRRTHRCTQPNKEKS